MLKLRFSILCEYIAEPIRELDGKLLGVEVLTRFNTGSFTQGRIDAEYFVSRLIVDTKRRLLTSQLQEIGRKAAFFIRYRLLCSVNIDFDMASIILDNQEVRDLLDNLPFVRLEISERFPNLDAGMKNPTLKALKERYGCLWLDDLGVGNANYEAVQSCCFETVKIDKSFFWHHCNTQMWPAILHNIGLYCDRIIIEGVESYDHLAQMHEQGNIGIQGFLYKGVPLSLVETLI
ncbi:EAL domain-containing protein [Affinibrenneria salicis]|uniref:EAL domain-containing protein n=1 Tax=Affinibrenneria salicis TaxID=2590031 RepID=A0A5J5G2B9_9GAMM|nr:EAL domain-containing protein [Affinibrenneria salicis]KAA9001047.1 EAL domain-containing protein [Affinibrenneria salicis]